MEYAARSRYQGAVAQDYVAIRSGTWQWRREQEIAGELIRSLPQGSKILDAPVGSGRFVQEYLNCGHTAIGVDISEDMLVQAVKEAKDSRALSFYRADVENLPLENEAVDCIICFRLANWLPLSALERTVQEFRRVTTNTVILHVRVAEQPELWVFVRRLWKARAPLRLALLTMIHVGRRLGLLKHRARKSELTYHRKEDVLNLFESNKLAIENDIIVEEGELGFRGIRNPLRIYVLRKVV